MADAVTARPRAQLDRPGMSDEALFWLRDALGVVRPRDPHSRRLGPPRYRLELLSELCERETFLLVTSWLGSEAVPSIKSKRDYADDLRIWANVAFELAGEERFTLGCITPGMIETWTKTQKAKNRAPRTINRRLSVLTAFHMFATYKLKEQHPSPVTKYDRPRVDPNDETTATPILEVPEFQRVVSQAETARQALVPVFIYTLAGRVSECCQSRLEQIKEIDGNDVLGLHRKGDKGQNYTLPPTLSQLIGVVKQDRTTGHILLDDDGSPLTPDAVSRLLTRLGRLAGVLPGRDLTPHVLRASRLTHLHDEGKTLENIRIFAGHSSITTTLGYIRRREQSGLKKQYAEDAVRVYENLVNQWVNPPLP